MLRYDDAGLSSCGAEVKVEPQFTVAPFPPTRLESFYLASVPGWLKMQGAGGGSVARRRLAQNTAEGMRKPGTRVRLFRCSVFSKLATRISRAAAAYRAVRGTASPRAVDRRVQDVC